MPALELRVPLLGAFALGAEDHLHRPLSLELWVRRKGRALALSGTIEAPGLAEREPVRGSARVRGRRLALMLRFASAAGPLVLRGETQLGLGGVPPRFTRCEGRIEDGHGTAVGRVRLRFDVQRELGGVLRSLRRKEA